MAFLSINEIFNLIIMTIAVGYIFSGRFVVPKKVKDPLLNYEKFSFWEDFKFAILVAAPGVILHELMHKIIALAFGLSAVFKAYWFGLGLGIILKLVNAPFLILAPAFVEISGNVSALESMLISFAGPGTNLALFLIAFFMLKRKLKQKEIIFWGLTKQINLVLFIFNMLPIPPLDGFKVFYGLWQVLT